MSDSLRLNGRLARELQHFDRHYAQEAARGINPLSATDQRRYTAPPPNTIFPREHYYHLLAPVKGKTILEIACGNGVDASILAHNGAQVYAYDISPRAVEVTRQRAKINGVSSRVHLQVCGHIERAFSGMTFDHVIGYGALHHLPLEGLAEKIYHRLKPGGVAVFAEPVANSKALQLLRRCVPFYHSQPTQDEAPMTDRDVDRFAQQFDGVVQRKFQMISRVWPFFPNSWSLARSLHRLDYGLLKLPPLQRFASVAVFGLHRKP